MIFQLVDILIYLRSGEFSLIFRKTPRQEQILRMKRVYPIKLLFVILSLLFSTYAFNQTVIRGQIEDELEPLIGANVVIKGTTNGTQTDFDGQFEIKTDQNYPITLVVSYIGYNDQELVVSSEDQKIKVILSDNAITTEVVEITGQRISDKQKAAPLTVESMDLLAIKETPADNFYDGLGALKGVDLTAASLGFKVINTRGFNSTSPVRSLQIIDGVDNQSPGLNFSLGNFLGSSELDVLKVDIIQGAASAYYGPNAFNGVIAMETKNPFLQKGLSAIVKAGERNLINTEVRWADAIKNKDGNDFFAYKLNFSYLSAKDWEATSDLAVDGSQSAVGNPGGWDHVNVYGDEYFSLADLSNDSANLSTSRAGLRLFHRKGYNELDLVDYDTRNIKANVALHFRTKPEATYDSPEFIISSSMGSGTTVYQGDNRFSLKNILFFQNRLEFRKKGKYFIRAYATNEDAGDSYDPYFTALRLQDLSKPSALWAQDYTKYWKANIYPRMLGLEYPVATVNDMGQLVFDFDEATDWLDRNQDLLTEWHAETSLNANLANPLINTSQDFLEPGTQRFQNAFDSIRALKNTEGGTLFYDKSALYHVHGEYNFETEFLDEIKVGANYRLYRPETAGTVMKDTGDVTISNSEFGIYTGLTKNFTRKLSLNATFRMDKNENFDYIFTPAASIVYSPDVYNYLRASFSSGVRNPTLADQYLNLNVGRATLLGNLEGYYNLITVESFLDILKGEGGPDTLNIDPIQPERVKTFEVGYRTTLFKKLYLDASYYFNIYTDFIGYNIGVDATIDQATGFVTNADVFRVAANSKNDVTTQGFSIAASYYFGKYYKFAGNYSFNNLVKSEADDPIIPAFNTPKHKYNLGLSGRSIPLKIGNLVKDFGFNFNYKWIQGFVFEGSPQFTGLIKDYGLIDGQISFGMPKINTTLKIGASNILDNKTNQTYGGPAIGRMAYISVLYDFKKK
jgi:iron complex outermembrane recepter protein